MQITAPNITWQENLTLRLKNSQRFHTMLIGKLSIDNETDDHHAWQPRQTRPTVSFSVEKAKFKQAAASQTGGC